MPVWVRDDAKNLIAAGNVALIRRALVAGPVFGYWYRPNSESGPKYWLVRDFAQFVKLVAPARPADYYVIWSLPALVERGLALVSARHADVHTGGASLLSFEALGVVEEYISEPRHAYIAVFYSLYGIPEVWAGGQDGLESLAESAVAYNKAGGEGYVFPFNTNYAAPDPDGLLPDTIERPEYWLVEAQYPNERGEIVIEWAG